MKRYLKFGLACVGLAGSLAAAAQTPQNALAFERAAHLKHGINTSIWFAQSPNNYSVDRLRTFTTEKDLQLIAKLGFDHIRLSIDAVPLTAWQHDDPAGKAFVAELDRVVDAAIADKLAVIIDVHPEDPYKHDLLQGDASIKALDDLWHTLAQHYASKGASEVYFELMNESQQTDGVRWGTIQAGLVDTIRSVDKVHTIIATGPHWSGLEDLLSSEPLKDSNVIYTFHDYEPFAFTHQGSTWAMSELPPLRAVPYPATLKDVSPNLNQEPSLQGRLYVTKYALDHWDAKRIDALLAFAETWSKDHGVPVYCGEFGVFRPYAEAKDRQRWIRDTRTSLERHGIGWAMWDYQTDFGLVTKKDGKTEVDKGVLNALGLKE
ncbi:MAG: glycoside hydrolase family 5 protein [Acidobacteriaceae bacterium]|nr:glycoside hydrolase family 5 protein [Acidobacteriaceae bacterium]